MVLAVAEAEVGGEAPSLATVPMLAEDAAEVAVVPIVAEEAIGAVVVARVVTSSRVRRTLAFTV